MIKRLADILAESVPRTTGTYTPAATVIRVAPEQITHGPFVGDLLDAVQGADVVEGVDGGGEAAVETEDLVVDEGRQRQVVEEVGEVFPHVGVAVFAEAFVVEAVDLGDLPGFVVASEDGDALGVADLEGDEEGHGLDGEVAPVNVVAHEEVVGVRVGTADLEELHQVVELAVDVTADGDGALDGLDVGFVL